MYRLIGYSENYSKTCGSLWHYCKDIPTVNKNDDIVNFNQANDAKITGQTDDIGEIYNVEIMIPLKYLSNFWRTLEMPLISCEVNLILTWSANCVILSTNIANQGATFTITETKLYVPIITLSTQDNVKLLAQLKSSFKRIINWNKYLSNPELLARNPNRLFLLAFENDTYGTSSKRYNLPGKEKKEYNVMIDGKNVFDQPIENDKIT